MVAPLYSIWENKKNNKVLLTILGYTKTMPDTGNLIVAGNVKKGVITITPEYLLENFKRHDE